MLPSNPLSLSEQLRRQTNELCSRIVRANCNTQYAQTASELTEFRRATATDIIYSMNDETLSETFRKTVHLTAYDSYAPFIARFFEKPCKASAIVDLLAPGFPDYITESSSTSGSLPKFFPKYNRWSNIRSLSTASGSISDPCPRRTTANVWCLVLDRMDVEDEENRLADTTIYKAYGSAGMRRMQLNLDPEKDKERMGTFILDHAAPYATGFITKWRSFLLIHALFSVSSKSPEAISMAFINSFVDMMRFLDTEFDMVVDCIENGTIPDLDGIEEIRHYLESNIAPDPERAAELRSLGRPSSQPGWCNCIWPNFNSITAVATGSFASSLPLAKWYLGAKTVIHTVGYGCTEGLFCAPYNLLELDQFKLSNATLVEFLDIKENDDSISSLEQLWEVRAGRRYELVLTTEDGLWRYRLGDVIEVVGFDPVDGVPIISFVERRNVTMRFPDFAVTESQLRATMSSVGQNANLHVVEWTAAIDDRHHLQTIGFFAELAGDSVADLTPGVLNYLCEELSRSNALIAIALADGTICRPTIRIVRPGTFSSFRQLRLDEGSNNVGQIKVPAVLPKAAYLTWFSNQVVHEL